MELKTVSIQIKDRHLQAKEVNKVLTEYGGIIINRLGLHVGKMLPELGISGYITVTVVVGRNTEFHSFFSKLNNLKGIKVGCC